MNTRQKLITIFLAILMVSFTALLIYFSLQSSNNSAALDALNKKVDKLQYIKPQNGHTPTDEELLNLIRPLIKDPLKGEKGDSVKGDSVKGDTGDTGKNGVNGKSCTTYTDENNDSYIECPDDTKTLIPRPDQPRQIEICTSSTVLLGWRYVGSTTCLKPRAS